MMPSAPPSRPPGPADLSGRHHAARGGPNPVGLGPWKLAYMRDLLRELVVRDIKIRYKRSVLGMGWTLLNPLAQMLVFLFVFRLVLPLNIPDYTAFLFTGILAWTWFQTSLLAASTTIVDNGALIRQPGFPAAVLPIVTVAAQLVHFLLALLVLLPFLVLTGHRIAPALILLPVLIGLQFLLSAGLAYVAAALHVTFRDTQYTIGLLLMLGFYLTPVFYDSARIPSRYWPVYALNPLVHLIDAYRAILLRGSWPAAAPLLTLALLSAGLFYLGYRVFDRARFHFVEEL